MLAVQRVHYRKNLNAEPFIPERHHSHARATRHIRLSHHPQSFYGTGQPPQTRLCIILSGSDHKGIPLITSNNGQPSQRGNFNSSHKYSIDQRHFNVSDPNIFTHLSHSLGNVFHGTEVLTNAHLATKSDQPRVVWGQGDMQDYLEKELAQLVSSGADNLYVKITDDIDDYGALHMRRFHVVCCQDQEQYDNGDFSYKQISVAKLYMPGNFSQSADHKDVTILGVVIYHIYPDILAEKIRIA